MRSRRATWNRDAICSERKAFKLDLPVRSDKRSLLDTDEVVAMASGDTAAGVLSASAVANPRIARTVT